MWIKYNENLWLNLNQIVQIGTKEHSDTETSIFVLYHHDVKPTTIDKGTPEEIEDKLETLFFALENSLSDKFVDITKLVKDE